MYCSNCGKEIGNNAVVCIYCGVATNLAPGVITAPPLERSKVNGFGIAGFVIGVLSLYFGLYFCIAPVIGLVFSIIGMADRKKCTSCNGFCIAGLVINIVGLLFWLFIWMFFFAVIMGFIQWIPMC